MKQRTLALAIKRIVWAELALSTAIAMPAFAQSQPATTGTAAATTTESAPAAAATPASGAAATPTADNNTATPAGKGVQQLKKFEVTIPRGIGDGQRIRLSGQGGAGRQGEGGEGRAAKPGRTYTDIVA